ncbi:methyltransferase domain-containing protein [Phlyctochytrium arcticum]|nr:methyltransferase domain-containing protein [Phlyctochytrium arcticum]
MADLDDLLSVLSVNAWWVGGFHLFDFFTTDLWSCIDPEWREFVDSAGPSLLDDLLDIAIDGVPKPTFPDSLQQHLNTVQKLVLDRTVRPVPNLGIDPTQDASWDAYACTKAAMSMKKLHEVDRLSRVIKRLAAEQKVQSIVDVGAGHGYLTHAVAEQSPSIQLYSIDCDDGRTCGSKRRGTQILNSVHHRKSPGPSAVGNITPSRESSKPVLYVTALLDPATLPEHIHSKQNMLIGLHSCGDLGGKTMLKTFLECKSVTALVIVACCYQRMETLDDKEQTARNFPLSLEVKSAMQKQASPLKLKHRSLATACLTFASFADRIAILSSIRGHYHRSLFELLCQKWEPLIIHRQQPLLPIGKLPRESERDFQSYSLAVCHKLGLLTSPEARSSLLSAVAAVEANRDLFLNRIAFVCVVKSLIAPCVERLILHDRTSYLKEGLGIPLQEDFVEGKGGVWLKPLFDFDISPRNMVIIARKDGGRALHSLI